MRGIVNLVKLVSNQLQSNKRAPVRLWYQPSSNARYRDQIALMGIGISATSIGIGAGVNYYITESSEMSFLIHALTSTAVEGRAWITHIPHKASDVINKVKLNRFILILLRSVSLSYSNQLVNFGAHNFLAYPWTAVCRLGDRNIFDLKSNLRLYLKQKGLDERYHIKSNHSKGLNII